MSDRILMTNRELTMGQVVETIRRFQAEMPDCEVFLDGDARAIVARPRKVSA